MARVMCVGIATLDIINRVSTYPPEDSEVRAVAHTQRTGGNAANTAMVLAQLGVHSVWVGNLSQASETADRDFARFGVDASMANRVPDALMPTSYILVSEITGSRSIVHYREMPEYSASHFQRLDLDGFSWIHFEGRATDQLGGMIAHARTVPGVTVSLEVEKPRADIEALFGQVDVVMFSRDYAVGKGFADPCALLDSLPSGMAATCTWGGQGAWGIERDGTVLHVPVPASEAVIDTLGAGDVFNAGLIHSLNRSESLAQALEAAVELASSQCTRDGLVLPV